jgi:hypothetical protein
MSSVVISGDSSGAITLTAPAVAGTNTLTLPAVTGTVLTSASTITRSQLPTGSVLQVVNALKSDSFTTTSGSAVDITGLTATITPTSATSKILIMTTFFCGSGSSPYAKFKMQRNGTDVFLGDAYNSSTRQSAAAYAGVDGVTTQSISVATQYLDSPATTSAVTYKWQVSTFSSRTIYVGRSQNDSDANGNTTPSSITLMEIAA